MILEAFFLTASFMVQDAESVEPPPESPDAEVVRILEAADEATRSVRAVQYHATFYGTGSFAASQPVVEGTVLKAFTEKDDRFMLIASEGWSFAPGIDDEQRVRFRASFDGSVVRRIEPERRIAFEDDASRAGQVLGPVLRVNMREYGHPAPFEDEVNAKIQQLEGRTLVGDVLCDIVYVEYDIVPSQSARWYFGVEDHLPRRVERLGVRDDRAGAAVLTLTDLNADPDVGEEAFNLEIPDGFSRRRTGGPRPSVAPVGTGSGR